MVKRSFVDKRHLTPMFQTKSEPVLEFMLESSPARRRCVRLCRHAGCYIGATSCQRSNVVYAANTRRRRWWWLMVPLMMSMMMMRARTRGRVILVYVQAKLAKSSHVLNCQHGSTIIIIIMTLARCRCCNIWHAHSQSPIQSVIQLDRQDKCMTM